MNEDPQHPPPGSTETVPETVPEAMKELAEQGGLVYRALTKLVAWTVFTGGLILLMATLVFITLALWRGIVWLWPVGEAAAQ